MRVHISQPHPLDIRPLSHRNGGAPTFFLNQETFWAENLESLSGEHASQLYIQQEVISTETPKDTSKSDFPKYQTTVCRYVNSFNLPAYKLLF